MQTENAKKKKKLMIKSIVNYTESFSIQTVPKHRAGARGARKEKLGGRKKNRPERGGRKGMEL